MIRPLYVESSKVFYLDQKLLPSQECYKETNSVDELIQAIKNLSIRGAPLLGLAGLCGLYLSALNCTDMVKHQKNVTSLKQARPTAIQLSSITEEFFMKHKHLSLKNQAKSYFNEALAYEKKMTDESLSIIAHAYPLTKEFKSILTHCNTGSLAMGGWGTALGIIIHTAKSAKKGFTVYYTETRPLLQGLRLTQYELKKNNIPAFCIIDSAAAFIIQRKLIDAIIVGADRIATNGDTANKIGTYMLALCAKKHQIPFYIAAPTSTIDYDLPEGSNSPIEYRSGDEISTRSDFQALNPAFDITPGELITAFITEKGVLYPPFQKTSF